MSDWHALGGSEKQHEIQVAFHIPVLDTDNVAGEKYRDALKATKPFAESVVSGLDAGEITELQAGAKYEHIETVHYDANLSDAGKIAIIDARYTALVALIQTKIQNKLTYWGYSHDI